MDRLEKALEKSRQQRAIVDTNFAPMPRAPMGNMPAYAFATPALGSIDEAQMNRHRIIAHHTRNREADIYRQLRTQILQIMKKSGLKSLAITSPHYGDGKTTIGINLGISIALDLKQTVLMVDLDLRKPNLHEYLGVSSVPG